jgi:hypothetical protein
VQADGCISHERGADQMLSPGYSSDEQAHAAQIETDLA